MGKLQKKKIDFYFKLENLLDYVNSYQFFNIRIFFLI